MTPDGGAAADPSSFALDVGDGHVLHVETAGPPDGIPAVYLHGGPGSGCQPGHRALFDTTRMRVVLFDQRGAGRSRPHGRRQANTTAHLVADMEAIRLRLGFETWMLVGGSWGATLALAYAEAHPERVSGIVLRATFLGTRAELEGAFIERPSQLRPDLLEDFLAVLPEAERGDPLPAYWRRILDPDAAISRVPALAWYDAERILSEIRPPRARLDPAALGDQGRRLPATPAMEAHYFANGCFLPDGALLADAHRLAGIPGVIVQGRYDLLCPPQTAFALAARWPDARIVMVEGAGHALSEPGVTEAVMAAIRDLARG